MAQGIDWSTIYLGQMADMDSDERSTMLENRAVLEGNTFGSETDPLSNHVITITTNSDDSSINRDNSDRGDDDTLSYDLGQGTQTAQFDTVHMFKATVVFADGSSDTNYVTVVQDTFGHVFLTTNSSMAFADKALKSITFHDSGNVGYDGWYQQSPSSKTFLCLASGTRIATPSGPIKIEELAVGDLVDTEDHGPQPLRWIGKRTVDLTQGSGQPPIVIPADALGRALPAVDLELSPQHCVQLANPALTRHTGRPVALVRACHLEGRRGIRPLRGRRQITYVTLLFDRHEVITAEGLPVESLYPGPQFLAHLSPLQRLEVQAALPRWQFTTEGYGPRARPLLNRATTRALAREALCVAPNVVRA